MSSFRQKVCVSDALDWIQKKINRLSVKVAKLQVCTGKPCSNSREYLIKYRGETLQYSPQKTDATLFILELTAVQQGNLPLI